VFEPLLERFRQGDRRSLARLLTLLARGEQVDAVRTALRRREGEAPAEPGGSTGASPSQASRSARVIAVTGSAGVGKSTLIGKFIELLRAKGQSVAVLACDSQSPLTGGALLGDRFRMPSRPDDPGVFIRSLAAAGGRGAVADHLDVMVDLLRAFGFDWIILETVGAGQGDTAVRELADVVVLLLQPEAGDDIQWEKAGLLEIADVVVIHKADLPGAERMEAQVRGLLNLPGCREVPVLRVSASKGEGLEELYRLLDGLPPRRPADGIDGHALLRLAQQRLAERFRRHADQAQPIIARWQQRALTDDQAVEQLLRLLMSDNTARP
jgi:LAO/AO transport system ATPase